MTGRELALKTKLRREVLRLLRCVGHHSDVFAQLSGENGQRCSSDDEISVALDILCGKVTARGGLDYVKEVFRFLLTSVAVGEDDPHAEEYLGLTMWINCPKLQISFILVGVSQNKISVDHGMLHFHSF